MLKPDRTQRITDPTRATSAGMRNYQRGEKDPRPTARIIGRKDMTMKKISAMTMMTRIAIIAVTSSGLATVAAGVASASLASDKTIKRDVAAVVWHR
ncbi:hypothetical protein AB0C34_18730 [Nocardia sp. NPDC049220]|uniref:hypothetical protein n=1 Tax=Nocardia sp. NPDC049220 TaxID=3155273 RepID=UPI0033E2707D